MAESPPRPGASPAKGEAAEGKSGDSQRPAAEQSGGKRHATMMGLAPAPHLGGLDASAGGSARAEADARRKRILERLNSLSTTPGGSAPAPPGRSAPGPMPTHRSSPSPEGKDALAQTAAMDHAGAPVRHSSTTAIIVGNYPNQQAAREAAQQAAAGLHATMPLERPSQSSSPPAAVPTTTVQVHAAQPIQAQPVQGRPLHTQPTGPIQPGPGAHIARAAEAEIGQTTVAMQRAEQGPQNAPGGMVVRPDAGRLRSGVPGPPPLGMASPAQIDRFRELRTRLLEMGQGVRLQRFTTLVVPLISGSGGSFVARNLAASFTMEGRGNSLLIDCNLHRPSQHLAFRMDSETGLFAFLEAPHGNFERLAQPTTLPGLGLITAGKARFREYFSSQPMRGLMHTVRQTDCFAFLDGPAVKGSPDARILSDLADFVILVVSYGKGTADEIAEAAASFDKNKFAGVVFNEQA